MNDNEVELTVEGIRCDDVMDLGCRERLTGTIMEEDGLTGSPKEWIIQDCMEIDEIIFRDVSDCWSEIFKI